MTATTTSSLAMATGTRTSQRRNSDVAREEERYNRWKQSLTSQQRVIIQPSASYDDSLFYSSIEFLEALKRAKTTKFFDCQLMDRMYLRVQGSLKKSWVVADFKLSDAAILAFKVKKGASASQQPENGWWRDTSRIPMKTISLSKDLILEPMVLEDGSNKKNQRMYTSKIVDTKTKKTVLRVSLNVS